MNLQGRMMSRDSLLLFAKATAVGIAAGLVAEFAGLPLPWMLGPLLAAAVVSLAGLRLKMPEPLRYGARGVVGVLLGSALDREVLARVEQWPVSLALLIVGVVAIVAAVSLYYRKAAGFDRVTSVASSLPGGLSSVSVIAIQLGAEPTRTIVSQLLRISLVVLLVPPLYALWQGGAEGPVVTAGGADLVGTNLWVVLLILPAGWAAGGLRFPVPELTGPMAAAAGLTLAGLPIALPDWLLAATFLVLGTSIGARFYGIGSPRQLLPLGGHALVATALIFTGAFALALLIHWTTGAPLPVALLAVIPGGIAEMAVLATALGVDPIFVTFHQLVRSVLLNALAPIVLRRMARDPPP